MISKITNQISKQKKSGKPKRRTDDSNMSQVMLISKANEHKRNETESPQGSSFSSGDSEENRDKYGNKDLNEDRKRSLNVVYKRKSSVRKSTAPAIIPV